jgi:hypothetical protein
LSRSRRRLAVGFVATLAALVPVSVAWACVAPVSLLTTNPQVQPGGTVHIIGRETAPGAPIEIHLDSVEGPNLLTVTGQVGGMTAKWEADVTIPANTPYGKHYLWGVQNYRNMNSVIPKAVIYVGTVPDPEPLPEVRATSMDVGSGPSGTTLALLALGVAGGGLLIAGLWTLLAGSGGGPKPTAERVKAS